LAILSTKWRAAALAVVLSAVPALAVAGAAASLQRGIAKEQFLRNVELLCAGVPAGDPAGDWAESVVTSGALADLEFTLFTESGRILARSSDRAPGWSDLGAAPYADVSGALRADRDSAVALGPDRLDGSRRLWGSCIVPGRASDGERLVLRASAPASDRLLSMWSALGVIGGAWFLWAALLGGLVVWRLGKWEREVEYALALSEHAAKGHQPQEPRDVADPRLARLTQSIERISERLIDQDHRLSALRHEQEAILRSVDGGVLVLDMQQRVLSMNRAAEWMLGFAENSARGRLLQEVARQPDLNWFVDEALNAAEFLVDELVIRGHPERRVRATSGHLNDFDNRRIGLLLVLADVTQLRRLEAVRSDFAANVSHELRTPITNIRGYLETLMDAGLEDTEHTREFLNVISRNVDRLGAIVEDMLTLTKLEESHGAAGPVDGESTLAREQVRVFDIVTASLADMEAEARGKSMTVLNQIPGDLWCEVNPALIQQAVSNLIANAVRYSPANRRIWLRGERISNGDGRVYASVSVVDEGPGIAASLSASTGSTRPAAESGGARGWVWRS